ncbi:MAG: hypothetical protein OEW12_09750 [Deltaproteobacteria bacterium]|nr:hypothetical protein [Deltaproteobacteria bacterium]
MIPFKKIKTVILDVAYAFEKQEGMEEATDLIWNLLDRDYQVFLVSSNQNHNLSKENFSHPRLTIQTEMPQNPDNLPVDSPLMLPQALWVTDHPPTQKWLMAEQKYLVHKNEISENLLTQRVVHLSELAWLLDPSLYSMAHVLDCIRDKLEKPPGKSLIVAIGGPPKSFYERFGLGLKDYLESQEISLVETVDMAHFLKTVDEVMESPPESGPWHHGEIRDWLLETILKPAGSGDKILIENGPPLFSSELETLFPFFLAPGSVLILYGEMVFQKEIQPLIDISVLVECSDTEITRRLYEFSEGIHFEPKFTTAYQETSGKIYNKYLLENQVAAKVDVRLDSSLLGVFVLKDE